MRSTSAAGQALRDQLLAALVELDVALEDPVEHLVGGQRVLVALVVAQLRRGRALDDRGGDRVLGAGGALARDRARGERAGGRVAPLHRR